MSEKKYPPEGIHVICKMDSMWPFIGYYYHERWYVLGLPNVVSVNVIEWWPLPEPGTGNKV